MNIDLLGKVPPQACEIEEAILGALMLESDAIEQINLKPEHFYKDSHQKIFKSILDLHSKKQPIDLLTVQDSLRKNGFLDEVGGPYYIATLTTKIASAIHVEDHSRIITEKFIRRELIRLSSEMTKGAFDEASDIDDIINNISINFSSINDFGESDHLKSWLELVKQAMVEAEKRQKLYNEGGIIGIPTPVKTLTKWTCGWQPKQLITIAGTPGSGKTAWALGCLKTAAVHGYKSALFSLEMSDVSIANRILIGQSGIDADNFRSGNIQNYEWEMLDKSISKILDYPILIDDVPKNINKICSKVRKLHKKGLIDLVVVDYLQLTSDDSLGKNVLREREVSSISRKLKLLAQELSVPVIELSQLNREVEKRANKMPQLSDLRESGDIENNSDLVILILRPEKYGLTEDENGAPYNGQSLCILAKQREGQTGIIPFKYNKSVTDIYDWEEIEVPTQIQTISYNPNSFLESNADFLND
jgi:replicative DNA helicase